MDTDFKNRLRKALEDAGITASDLSRLSGVGKGDISHYLKGSYLPKQDKCYLLAKALHVDPGWLMTGVVQVEESDPYGLIGEYVPRTEESMIIVRGIDHMPLEKREQALNVLRAMFPENADLFNGERK